MTSVHDRLVSAKWRPSGFDYLRLVLAVLIAFQHCTSLSQNINLWDTAAQPLLLTLLPMFFCLSGFLVAGSLLRCKTILKFLGLRIIRIFPALMTEVLLSAFIIGPIATTYPLVKYFSDSKFRAYLLNMIGDIHFDLPGLFQNNITHFVNYQLWTVPWELYCYVSISIISIIAMRKHRIITLIVTISILISYLVIHGIRHNFDFSFGSYSVPGFFLVFSFLVGACAFMYKEKIPHSFTLFAVSTIFTVLFAITEHNRFAVGNYLSLFTICYMTIYLGSLNPRRLKFISASDYSYGIFLYHYVIQQTCYQFLPVTHHWYWMALISGVIVFMAAAASWHLIEKPALSLRTHLDRWETSRFNRANARA